MVLGKYGSKEGPSEHQLPLTANIKPHPVGPPPPPPLIKSSRTLCETELCWAGVGERGFASVGPDKFAEIPAWLCQACM